MSTTDSHTHYHPNAHANSDVNDHSRYADAKPTELKAVEKITPEGVSKNPAFIHSVGQLSIT